LEGYSLENMQTDWKETEGLWTCPRTTVEVPPSRTLENAFLPNKISVVFVIDLYAEKGTVITQPVFIKF